MYFITYYTVLVSNSTDMFFKKGGWSWLTTISMFIVPNAASIASRTCQVRGGTKIRMSVMIVLGQLPVVQKKKRRLLDYRIVWPK